MSFSDLINCTDCCLFSLHEQHIKLEEGSFVWLQCKSSSVKQLKRFSRKKNCDVSIRCYKSIGWVKPIGTLLEPTERRPQLPTLDGVVPACTHTVLFTETNELLKSEGFHLVFRIGGGPKCWMRTNHSKHLIDDNMDFSGKPPYWSYNMAIILYSCIWGCFETSLPQNLLCSTPVLFSTMLWTHFVK